MLTMTFDQLYRKLIMQQRVIAKQIPIQKKYQDYYESEKFKQQELPIIQQAFEYTLNQYKEEFQEEFDEVELQYMFKATQPDLFAELGRDLDVIIINLYPIVEQLYYNRSLDDILDWQQYQNYTVAHQLAHINDILFNGYVPEDPHTDTFKEEFKRLTGKGFQD